MNVAQLVRLNRKVIHSTPINSQATLVRLRKKCHMFKYVGYIINLKIPKCCLLHHVSSVALNKTNVDWPKLFIPKDHAFMYALTLQGCKVLRCYQYKFAKSNWNKGLRCSIAFGQEKEVMHVKSASYVATLVRFRQEVHAFRFTMPNSAYPQICLLWWRSLQVCSVLLRKFAWSYIGKVEK